MAAVSKLNITVMLGGPSAEREVSLRSGAVVHAPNMDAIAILNRICLLDFMCWNSIYNACSFLLTVIQYPGLIISISHSTLIGMDWNHAVSIAVEKQPLQHCT